jgi:GNAT superfamily N-acetyltransferase
VRPARAADADTIGRIQLAAWRDQYADVLPADALAAMSAADLGARWRESITAPPSPRHLVVVAVDGAHREPADGAERAEQPGQAEQQGDTAGDDRRVTGFAAFGPTDDPDCDAETTAELFALTVDPAETGRGHGSRLLAACADLLREAGFSLAVCWVLLDDARFRAFLQETGWAPDGAYRDLDRGDGGPPARSVRLQTALG